MKLAFVSVDFRREGIILDAVLDRIAGATSEINALREAFNRGEMPITESSDIYAIGDLIKSWFRLLPEPVFPSLAYFAIIEAISASVFVCLYSHLISRVMTEVENLHARLSSIRSVVHALPRANFDLLKRVAEHLDKCVFFTCRRAFTSSL